MASKYPYPSDVNVREFVTVKLSQTNYFTWRSMMLSLIQSHGLRGFIYNRFTTINGGGSTEEEEIEKDDDWRRTDELLRGWILATLNEDLFTLVEHQETAKQVWAMLEEKLTQPFLHGIDTEQTRVARNNISPYLPLARAALKGDWEKAKKVFKQEPNAVRAIITGASETALMVAARSVLKNHYFIRKLVNMMTPADLAMVDYSGSTALHMAARAGNINAAKLLVNKNPRLPNIPDNDELVPLHIAVLCCKKEMALYLFGVTKENEKSKPFEDERGRTLLSALIASGFYDIALLVVQRFPELVRGDPSPLQSIALKGSDFESGARFNLWQHWIYSCVPISLENMETWRNDSGDIEDAADSFMSVRGTKLKPNLDGLIWKFIGITVPLIKHVRNKKLIHHQALQFVKHLCKEIVQFDYSDAVKILRGPLHMAASIGVHEIVEEILESFPSSVYLTNAENQTIFHIAIKNRRENVFNIIYQFPGLSHIFFKTPDVSMNTGLHLAGLLGDHQRQCLRTCAVGPALQMQREVQWFQEVEKLSVIMDKQQLNNNGKTPIELFNETHQELMTEGEQWMKGTSSSCTIVAALIVTIVFAASITVPGGNKAETGLPFFSTRKAFIIFAISDALALFSSTSSLLLFLSIQSSHFAEQDFLSALPKRLITGFLTLFLSILFMMIAFAATLQIVFGDTTYWILVPVIGLACIPVTLFASLQFPRLIDMIKCTYGSGNFCKQRNRPLF